MENVQLLFPLAVIYTFVSDDVVCGMLFWEERGLSLLEGKGEVVLAGLAVSHQVARLFAQPEQRLGVCPADGSMVPAASGCQ